MTSRHTLAGLAGLTLLLCTSIAAAQTTQGTMYVNETWTGNITLTGDVTVPSGVTLTIAPGAVISMSPTDAMGGGSHTGQIELIISGALNAVGTSTSGITLKAKSGQWYGVRLNSGSTSSFDRVTVRDAYYGIHAQGSFTFKNGVVRDNNYAGLRTSSNPTVEIANSQFFKNGRYAMQLQGGTVNIHHNEIWGNCSVTTSQAVYISSGTVTFDHNTVAYNQTCSYAVYVTSASSSHKLTNNIIAKNGQYGVYCGSGTQGIQYNLVWDHSTNVYRVGSSNAVTYNPLFVSATNHRLTHRSPARKADSSGADLGALPYVSDQTTALHGKIFADLTLPAGTHSVVGDLLVAKNVTLTLSPGATLSFANSDDMGGGSNVNQGELVVESGGKLSAVGTASSRVTLKAASGQWYGVRLPAGSSATLDYVTISGAYYGIYGQASFTFKNGVVRDAGYAGMRLSGSGVVEIATSQFLSNDRYALFFQGGTVNAHHNQIRDNCGAASAQAVYISGGTVTFDHNTVAYNPSCSYGVYTGSAASTYKLTNNIVANNGQYGVFNGSGTLSINNNLVWGHSTNIYRVSHSNGVIYNPLFVSGTNLRLTHRSPARKADQYGADLGALPYVSDQTPKLHGKIFADLTLPAGAHTVPGDLMVTKGVKLTLSPGATLSFGSGDDMGGGASTSQAELVVESTGTLTAVGTASSRVTLKTASGQWFGVKLNAGSNATFEYLTVQDGYYGIYGYGSYTLKNSLVRNTGYAGIRTQSGIVEIASSMFLSNDRYAMMLQGGVIDAHHNELRGNCKASSSQAVYITTGTVTFDHNTVAYNQSCSYGVYTTSASTLFKLTNNIVATNGQYGVYNGSGTLAIQNNLIWGHSTNVYRVSSQSGLTSNPLFVSSSDVHLQASSPARKKANDGSDLGCYPYLPGTPDRVVISPASASVAVKGTQVFTATVYDATNNPVAVNVTWSASAGGTISTGGVFTAGCKTGTFSKAVTASVGNISATADVVVTAGAAATLTVSPPTASVAVKGTKTYIASGKDACGNAVALSPSPTWSVSSTAAGTISQAGLFTAGCTPGGYSGVIKAASGSLSGSAGVTVTIGTLANLTLTPKNPTIKSGAKVTFTAQGSDSCGNALTAAVGWAVINGGGAITTAGIFTAGLSAGTFLNTVQASAGSVKATTSVTVTGGAQVAKVVVTPSTSSVAVGKKATYTAVAYDAANNALSATFAWAASSGGTMDQTGSFTAGTTAGTFSNVITATAGGVSGQASVTVLAGPAASVKVTPASVTLAPGGNTSFTAKVADGFGNTRTDTVTWAVSPATAGSIDQAGKFTAGGTTGTYVDAVSASVSGLSDKSTVVVKAGALHHLTITPTSATLKPSGSTVFSVKGFDASNNPVTITPTFKVVASGGTISGQGLFVAGTKAGTYKDTVQATAGSLTISASVLVQAGALATLALSPNAATLAPAGKQLFAATGADLWGNAVQATVTWSVINGGGAISSTGLFTAGTTAGTYTNTVQAKSGIITATASVTVGAASVAKVVISPDPGKVAVGKHLKFTATAYDASNNVVAAPVSWATSATAGGGAIDQTGNFAAHIIAGTFPGAVIATAGGVKATATVEILAGPVETIKVTPSLATVAPGGSTSFTAKAADTFGNVRQVTMTWAVSPASAGTIDQSGNLTAGNTPGTFINAVSASAHSRTGSASLVIKAGALHHLTLTPLSATLKPSASVAFSVKGFDAKNNSVTITPTWKVINGGGSITAQGIFVAGSMSGTYNKTVVVTASGLSAAASVVVQPGPLNRLDIKPSQVTVAAGKEQQFTVSGADLWGNTVSPAKLTWGANKAAGTITLKGLFTAGAKAGLWPSGVTATAGNISATAAVTVTVPKPPVPPPTGDDTGCSCSFPGAPATCGTSAAPALLGLFLLGLFMLRRRRSR